ncbi:triacylglycerol lipase OBL1-like [Henckelia pumila]|uniref:triacylglycerol lipase OBL1-like n=1 Tax=Henckelia pumila TaxID=405737 RepID=UPI003C6DF0E6
MASKVSYENENCIRDAVQNHWEMDFLGFYEYWNDYQEKATTQAFAFQDKINDAIIIAFRGTEPFDADAWRSDIDISWYELPAAGKVHGGFMKALGLQKSLGWPQEQPPSNQETAYYGLRKLLKQTLLNNAKAKFILTGHSLGGALAVLFPAVLALHNESFLLERLEGVYTFGQPRVGDQSFGEFMKKNLEKYDIIYHRYVYSYDMVPRLPFDNSTFLFKHFGTCIYHNSFYKAKIVTEEPDKNYFSILWLIPKIANSLWELIRSFTISYTKGSEYKETTVFRFLRVMGLFAAGIPAHFPPDYVNATRLASPDLFLLKDH